MNVNPPEEQGLVAFEIEVVPHNWPNDGKGWHTGRDTPQRVAQILRDYADQVEFFTGPNDPQVDDTAAIAEKVARHARAEHAAGQTWKNGA